MKYELLSSTGSKRLVLIYAGWGMDAGVFAGITCRGYDVAVVWDYRHYDIDWQIVDRYSEICIVAWSLGVYASMMSTHGIASKVTLRIAVNGTPHPVDDQRGIPVEIYRSTRNTLDERRLEKFRRRMCGSRQLYEQFSRNLPERAVDELIAELDAVWPGTLLSNIPVDGWDCAYVGQDDAIFPAVNQFRAWKERGVVVRMVDEPHYIDLQRIIDREIVNKEQASSRFGRQRSTYNTHATVQANIVERLSHAIERYGIADHLQHAGRAVLEIGQGTGLLTSHLLQWVDPGRLHLWDIAPDAFNAPGADFRCCDAEIEITRTLPERFDAIISASTIQWFNSQRRFLAEAARVLRPGGWLVMSSFTAGNLQEVAQATGRALPLPDAEQWLEMLPESLEVVEFTTLTAELVFDDPEEVFRHLHNTGVNALGNFGAGAMRRALRDYPMRLDGRFYLTYKPFILIARKVQRQ